MRWLLLIPLLCGVSAARTLHVPAQYETIQAALDAVADDDTVAIAPGTYGEALYAPPRRFVMRGLLADTLRLPILDPSPIPGSDTLSVLSVPSGAEISFRYLCFRNGALMYPHHRRAGGISMSTDRPLQFDHCVWDSVRWGIGTMTMEQWTDIVLQDCRFLDCSGGCVSPGQGRVRTERCLFIGRGNDQVVASDGSRISNCSFQANGWAWSFLNTGGHDVLVQQCTFGPTSGDGVQQAVLTGRFNGYFVDNVIRDCRIGLSAVDFGVERDHADTAVIARNLFENLSLYSIGGTAGVRSACDTICPGAYGVEIRDNVFENCVGGDVAGVVQVRYGTEITGNSFRNCFGAGSGIIGTVHDVAVTHDNLFFGDRDDGYAFEADGWPMVQDARWNWWGDTTGPYHPTLNPTGLGRQVSDAVEFIPFYADSGLSAVPRPGVAVPAALTLSVAPNPFNAVSVVTLNLPPGDVVRLSLHDVLGREVAELFHGRVETGQLRVPFGSTDWASGTYFVRAQTARSTVAARVVLLR